MSVLTREDLAALQQQTEKNPTSLAAKQAYINGLKYHLHEADAQHTAMVAELEQYKAAIEVIQSSRDICLNTFTAWAKDDYGPAKMALRKLPEVEQRNAALVEALEHVQDVLEAQASMSTVGIEIYIKEALARGKEAV